LPSSCSIHHHDMEIKRSQLSASSPELVTFTPGTSSHIDSDFLSRVCRRFVTIGPRPILAFSKLPKEVIPLEIARSRSLDLCPSDRRIYFHISPPSSHQLLLHSRGVSRWDHSGTTYSIDRVRDTAACYININDIFYFPINAQRYLVTVH
jgi:hypothetical protein